MRVSSSLRSRRCYSRFSLQQRRIRRQFLPAPRLSSPPSLVNWTTPAWPRSTQNLPRPEKSWLVRRRKHSLQYSCLCVRCLRSNVDLKSEETRCPLEVLECAQKLYCTLDQRIHPLASSDPSASGSSLTFRTRPKSLLCRRPPRSAIASPAPGTRHRARRSSNLLFFPKRMRCNCSAPWLCRPLCQRPCRHRHGRRDRLVRTKIPATRQVLRLELRG